MAHSLLFPVVFSETGLILLLVFGTPLRKLVVYGLDRVKRGRGPLVVKVVAGTISVIMISNLFNAMKISEQWIDGGSINPPDQILLATLLLDCALMGASIFLALMIDRIHHYIRELRIRRKDLEAVKKQGLSFENEKAAGSGEIKGLEQEKTTLITRLKELEHAVEMKAKDIQNAEANAIALRKQSEGFLLEYDRLLKENQNLRRQLQSLDLRFSRSALSLRKPQRRELITQASTQLPCELPPRLHIQQKLKRARSTGMSKPTKQH